LVAISLVEESTSSFICSVIKVVVAIIKPVC
jgi:hypothetical protein